jgi:hypothetical protein
MRRSLRAHSYTLRPRCCSMLMLCLLGRVIACRSEGRRNQSGAQVSSSGQVRPRLSGHCRPLRPNGCNPVWCAGRVHECSTQLHLLACVGTCSHPKPLPPQGHDPHEGPGCCVGWHDPIWSLETPATVGTLCPFKLSRNCAFESLFVKRTHLTLPGARSRRGVQHLIALCGAPRTLDT